MLIDTDIVDIAKLNENDAKNFIFIQYQSRARS
jgi:hypothetical protein